MTDPALSRLRTWLSEAHLPEGARLPAERTLAEDLNITRSELRKALQVLELEGRLTRHVGRGTFLASQKTGPGGLAERALVPALAEITGPHEAMVARLALEPELARLAALHATPRQLAELKRLAAEMQNAQDWQAYEDLDAAFHDLIAESTGNPLLHEVQRLVNGVRKAVVWGRLSLSKDKPAPDYHSFAEHAAILTALERRDRAGARDAMRAHINATLGTMLADD